MTLKKAHRVSVALYLASALAVLAYLFVPEPTDWTLLWFSIAFGVFFLGGFFVTLFRHRCPQCDQPLPLKLRLQKQCPYCQTQIDT